MSTHDSDAYEQQAVNVCFVDDHFLLQLKRIEAICKGIIDADVTIQWGCEGCVDSVAQHLFQLWLKPIVAPLCLARRVGAKEFLID